MGDYIGQGGIEAEFKKQFARKTGRHLSLRMCMGQSAANLKMV